MGSIGIGTHAHTCTQASIKSLQLPNISVVTRYLCNEETICTSEIIKSCNYCTKKTRSLAIKPYAIFLSPTTFYRNPKFLFTVSKLCTMPKLINLRWFERICRMSSKYTHTHTYARTGSQPCSDTFTSTCIYEILQDTHLRTIPQSFPSPRSISFHFMYWLCTFSELIWFHSLESF